MPIQPKNKKRYPKNWKEISRRIRFERAKGKCEWCGVEHGSYIHRDKDGSVEVYEGISLEVAIIDEIKLTKVVLTTAHLNHTPEDCRDENLVALCQKCHLGYDLHRHIHNRKVFKDQRIGQGRFWKE